MDRSTKKLIGVGLSLLFFAFALLGFLIFSDRVGLQKQSVKIEPKEESSKQANTRLSGLAQDNSSELKPPAIISNSMKEAPSPASSSVTKEVEDPVSEILSSMNSDFASGVRELLAAMPTLNPEQQAEAAQHIANLSDDKLAAQWSQKIIFRQLPDSAAEVLFNDMLNRPHELLMPFLSKLADMPQHPQSSQSGEILDVLFGQPPVGSNWEKWVKIKAQEVP